MSDPFNRVPAAQHAARHTKLRYRWTPDTWVIGAGGLLMTITAAVLLVVAVRS